MKKSRNWKTMSSMIAGLGDIEIFVVNDIDYRDSQLMQDVLDAREEDPDRPVWRLSELNMYMDNVEPDPEGFKRLCMIKKHFKARIRAVQNPIF